MVELVVFVVWPTLFIVGVTLLWKGGLGDKVMEWID